MGIRFETETLDGIDDSIKNLYKEATKDGKKVYRLDVEDGAKPISEFNAIHGALEKERKLREEYEKKTKAYGDFTPDTVKALKDELEGLKLSGSAKPNEELIKKLDELRADHQRAMAQTQEGFKLEKQKYEAEIQAREQKLTQMKLEQQLQVAFSAQGNPTAFPLVKQLAETQLLWNENLGEFRTKDGSANISDWLNDVAYKSYPFFLKGNVSGGAVEGNAKYVGAAKYFDPKSPDYNLTKQGEIYKTDRAAYEALSKQYSRK